MGITYPNPIRVLCVDDDNSYTQLLCAILASELDIHDVGVLRDLSMLDEAVRRLCPDIVLLDADIHGRDPLDVIRTAVAECPEARVIVMSRNPDPEAAAAAIDAGARGYMHKSEQPRSIADAVRRVMQDELVVRN